MCYIYVDSPNQADKNTDKIDRIKERKQQQQWLHDMITHCCNILSTQLPQCLKINSRQTSYVRPRNTGAKMYAGRVACCPLLSHVKYAPRALLRLEKDGTDGWIDWRTDARPLHYASSSSSSFNKKLSKRNLYNISIYVIHAVHSPVFAQKERHPCQWPTGAGLVRLLGRESNTNNTALKTLLVSSRGVTAPGTDCVGHLAKKDGLENQLCKALTSMTWFLSIPRAWNDCARRLTVCWTLTRST